MEFELVEFEDDVASFKCPKGWKRKRGIDSRDYMFFIPKRERLDMLHIMVDPVPAILDGYRALIDFPYRSGGPDPHFDVLVLSQGKSGLRPGGIELIIRTRHRHSGTVEHRWDMIFDIEGHTICFQVLWTGGFDEHERTWAEVIQSIRVKEAGTVKKEEESVVPVSQVTPVDWRTFLEELSADLLTDPRIRESLPKELVDSGWLGFPGASEQDIEKAERRLGVRFPDSYRSFLEVSNGWRATGPFIWEVCSTETVRWFREDNTGWIQAYTEPTGYEDENGGAELPDEEYFVYGEKKSPDFRTRYLKTALQVSEVGSSAVYLLCPKGVTPSGEWEAWFFANWISGAERFESFRALMEDARERY